MALPVPDTNILLRHLLRDDPVLSSKATAILERTERGDIQVRTSDIVVFETILTLQRSYKQPRGAIVDAVLPLLELTGIVLPGKRLYRRVFGLYRSSTQDFADCYHVILMQQSGISEILSFDTDFDRVAGVTRREA